MKRTDSGPLVVGVAGIMGAGKSTVAKVFEELGAKVVEADAVGKDLYKDPDLKRSVLEVFGRGVTGADGEIDTRKLGNVAFRDAASARKLNELTQRALIESVKAKVEHLRRDAGMIVVDAALLPEWESKDWLDILIVVDSCEDTSLRRSCAGMRFTPANVRARMRQQFSRRRKTGCADMVIPNYGSLDQLKERARKVFWTLMGITGKG